MSTTLQHIERAAPPRRVGWLATLAWLPGVVASWLPRRVVLWCATVLGWLWFYGVPVRRGWTLAHLRAALPERAADHRRIARQVFVAQAANVLEMLAWRRLARCGGQPDWLFVEGQEHLESARLSGRPVLVLTAHMGNFDLVACAQARELGELVVVSKRLSWGALDRLWMATRARFGVRAVRLDRALVEAMQALRAGTVVAMVLDQHAPERRAIEHPFLGLPARTSAALATLAVRTDALIVPCFAERNAHGEHVVRFEAPLEVPGDGSVRERIETLTAACLARVERAVRRTPAQWLWLHRRWKDTNGRPRVRPGLPPD